MQYKAQRKPIPQIARELNVDAVVEGAVLRSGDRVRISAQLIQANPEKHLWAESYDRSLRDVLALQSEVAQAIAGEIQIKLSPQEAGRLPTARPVKPESVRRLSERPLLLEQAGPCRCAERIAVLPAGGGVWTPPMPSRTRALPTLTSPSARLTGSPPQESFPKAKAAALKALEIDDNLAEAHTSLAEVKNLEWDWNGAEIEYQRALALNPSYAIARLWHSVLLSFAGQHEAAISEAERAQELDPLSSVIGTNLGQVFYNSRQYEKAREAVQKTLEVSPDFLLARFILGLICLQENKLEEAVTELQAATALFPEDDQIKATLGYAYARSGRRGDAQQILTELKAQSRTKHVSPYLIASIYVGLGEKSETLDWLEEAYRQRDIDLPFIRVNPVFDPLRAEPRFASLVRKINPPML